MYNTSKKKQGSIKCYTLSSSYSVRLTSSLLFMVILVRYNFPSDMFMTCFHKLNPRIFFSQFFSFKTSYIFLLRPKIMLKLFIFTTKNHFPPPLKTRHRYGFRENMSWASYWLLPKSFSIITNSSDNFTNLEFLIYEFFLMNTIFPHIRPAGIIFLQGLQLRLLLECGHVFQKMSLNDQFWSHKPDSC